MIIITKHSAAFAWNYTDIKGIHADICKHHIYIKEDASPVRQLQGRMNPALKDIVNEAIVKTFGRWFYLPHFL